MTKNNFIQTQRNTVLFVAAILILFECVSQNLSQTAAPQAALAKPTKAEPANSSQSLDDSNKIKVVFDETAPGVVIIEADGKKIRVDSNKKTVEQVSAMSPETAAVAVTPPATVNSEGASERAVAKSEVKAHQKAESAYSFEPGEEPYDYRLVNVPTPKSVPKGSWNLSFSHRFSQPINPVSESGKNLLGFDSFAVSSFGLTYGITNKLYISGYRSPLCQKGLCRTIEAGFGYHWLSQSTKSPIALSSYASVEGNENFTQEYTYNLETMISGRVGKRVYLFFSPTVSLNSNGQHRFNPRTDDFFPPAAVANTFRLPTNGASFGFGTNVRITPTIMGIFEFTPRTGFKLGRTEPVFDNAFNVIGFNNVSHPEIGFGIQKNIGQHAFTLTFSNTQTTTTSRYNSSNLVLSPKKLVIGFNLFRRF